MLLLGTGIGQLSQSASQPVKPVNKPVKPLSQDSQDRFSVDPPGPASGGLLVHPVERGWRATVDGTYSEQYCVPIGLSKNFISSDY